MGAAPGSPPTENLAPFPLPPYVSKEAGAGACCGWSSSADSAGLDAQDLATGLGPVGPRTVPRA